MSQLAGRKEQSTEHGIAAPGFDAVSGQQGAVTMASMAPALTKTASWTATDLASGGMGGACAAEATVAEKTRSMSAQSHFIMAGS
ncbi:hypothetical protein [Nitratireductor sp. XY-223]|uniref:hypothetical protein n=1 Tax=Nitratireductor sp. XY-223 TaxID=2561926 RepID=UPI0010AAB3F3|nr:hypothetical protein [Nitratireductor sp. XY-223]